MSDVRDLRDVLEAVVYGEDDRIRPADRVRSAELLRELNALGLDDLFRLETGEYVGRGARRCLRRFDNAQKWAQPFAAGGFGR